MPANGLSGKERRVQPIVYETWSRNGETRVWRNENNLFRRSWQVSVKDCLSSRPRFIVFTLFYSPFWQLFVWLYLFEIIRSGSKSQSIYTCPTKWWPFHGWTNSRYFTENYWKVSGTIAVRELCLWNSIKWALTFFIEIHVLLLLFFLLRN